MIISALYPHKNKESVCWVGIDKLFLEEIKKWLLTKRINHINLSVYASNSKAYLFFEKLGFTEKFKTLYLQF